jgi:hypothetical protein
MPGAALQVIAVWRGSQLIGAAPLYLHTGGSGALVLRRLMFMSTGEPEFEETCPDYLDVLYRIGEERASVDAIWRNIERLAWDELEFLDVPADTPLLGAEHMPTGIRKESRGVCPLADLTGGFETYLSQLSANTRQQARRLLRDAGRAGVILEIVDQCGLAGAFDDLVRLHQERWVAEGKQGVFAAPRFVEFHRRLIEQWQPSGRVVLARLRIASETLAVLYGFVTRGTFEFYQSGIRFEDREPIRSPGIVAHLLLMRALIGRGITKYDFLRGSASYKTRLTTGHREVVKIEIRRWTPRAVLFRPADAARRALTRIVSQARGHKRSTAHHP